MRALLEGMTRAEVLGCEARNGLVAWNREMHADVHRVFGGVLQSCVTCSECNHASVTTEPFLDLSLEIARISSVEKALGRFTDEEILQGDNRYRCEACRKLVNASKRFSVRRAPNVLTLHLKRFDRSRKDGRFVQYPDQLDMTSYMYGRPNGSSAVYTLSAVLIHQGSSRQCGHYLAYVKGTNGTWCIKDDSTSRPVSAATVMKQKAYVLFYTRKQEKVAKVSKSPKSNSKFGKKVKVQAGKQKQKPASPPVKPHKATSTRIASSPIIGPSSDVELSLSEESSLEDVSYHRKNTVQHNGLYQAQTNQGEDGWAGDRFGMSKVEQSSPNGPSLQPNSKSADAKAKAFEGTSEKFLKPIGKQAESQSNSNVSSERRRLSDDIVKRVSESLPSPRKLLAPVVWRLEGKPTVEGENSKAERTFSEPALSLKRLDSHITSNVEKGLPEKSLGSSQGFRKFLGPVGRRNTSRLSNAKHEAEGSSENDTIPSEPNSSADDDEPTNGSSRMKDVFIGGGTAVQKVIRRVFGVPQPSSRPEKKAPINRGHASVSSRQPSEVAGDGWGSKDGHKIRPPTDVEAAKAITPEKRKPEAQTSRGRSSPLFGDEGVAQWDTSNISTQEEGSECDMGLPRRSFARSKIVKRRRVSDVQDADYDRGKPKKARHRQNGGYGPVGLVTSAFEQFSENRRRRSELRMRGSETV